ncbi:alpha/beta hydrolase [Phenylobacterium sp. 20VBR1]|uniref:Alpha/beta hydrolase n=1 Tax=Phenylobacterium glaciei TaxID=2803784 RepID=A0A941CX74_9CAUL|nr:alpha/beta hydrolase [Phenylobacterium glaciei]MBR7618355.1 alpha/beta hydrolase [Phenylobacterium glaciei]
MPEFRTLDLPDISLRVAMEGSGPLVVLVHGFPESWYSWRHQMGPIAAAGFTACAIDVRGYGGSGKPADIAAYDMEHMVGDVAALIEHLTPGEKAVLVGHDWGAPIVWNSALIRPDKVRAVAGLSVPYTGVPRASFMDLVDKVFTQRGKFFYQAWFQDVGPPEAELEADPRMSIRKFYYAISGDAPDGTWPNDKVHGQSLLDGLVDPDPFPAWLTEADLDYYAAEFAGSGFFGPLSRYRNHQRDFEYLSKFEGRKIEQPSLFIGGERDLVLSMLGRGDLLAIMGEEMTDLRGADILEGCGHWTQQERPEEVNARLIPWLKGL